ncbi:hypothetical protein GP486_000268 [Trichoglossum hirsutum]|uniref:Uncharacterized protein n=1 Tax=Trichoglossum hirsutum TaxID=265104 RepID=A0A9P8LIV2_9PEZI|nr:hypothetical protein GP486_000268 [Trichoglossum hirsutum]
MPHSRLYYIPEEGKRSDDRISRDWSSFIYSFLFWRGPSRFRRRRILLIVITVLFLYFLWTPDLDPPTSGDSITSRGPSTEEQGDLDGENRYYNGPIKFPRLGYTLHSVRGNLWRNNVLFTSASLESASAMVPMACEMARYRRNAVHFALLGRSDMSIDEFLVKNGIENGCDVRWHGEFISFNCCVETDREVDGRPEHSVSSTDSRMEASVFESLGLIISITNPWVVIVDDLEREEAFFARSVSAKTQSTRKPVLELPRNAVENLMWLTRLDCGSLRAWNEVNVEVVIQVPSEESGSLIRLLKSLENADYFSSTPPGLTVELPQSVDGPTLRFLENFAWPPPRPGKQRSGRLKLRRRMRLDTTTEESSLRFIESFFPADRSTSHVLFLSPRVELSPLFYHYLKYALLEYKHSEYGFQVSNKLTGIALNLPSTYPNASSPFIPPLTRSRIQDPSRPTPENSDQATPFLWQAPGSDAALYFGDKWVELQDFLSNRLDAIRKSPTTAKRPKSTDSNHTPWMEYLYELSRAMGYVMLYPNWESGGSFATVHNELTPQTAQNALADQPSVRPPRELPLISGTALIDILPVDGDLPDFSDIPILSFDGRRVSRSTLDTEAAAYAAAFRREIGRCTGSAEVRSIWDLFCLWDREDGDWVDTTLEPTSDATAALTSKSEDPVMSSTTSGLPTRS